MAIVRELITVLGTEFDDKGVKQYETGLRRLKEIAISTAGAIGVALSIDKIAEFVDGLIESGQEVLKLRAQIANIARPMDDVNAAMERTFQIAQETGVAYTEVVDNFRDFLQSSKEAKVSQEELLNVTENIFKAFKVERASAETQARLSAIVNRIDVIGKASPRMIGMIANTSRSVLTMLQDYFHADEEGLRTLAKQGKITFEEFTKALSRVSPELEDKFAKVPWTIGRAFTYARNQMVLATAEFLKVTRLSIILGTVIKQLTDIIIGMFKSFFTAIGGLKNAIEVLGIAMAIVLGPRMLAYLIDMVAWMWKFAAANWASVAPWVAMAAAIAAVAIAIQDLVYWIQGKPSLIGTWVGSFADLKKNFASMDIFAGFRIFDDLMKGDWKKAIEDLGIALTNTKAIVLEISVAIAAVTAGFVAWNLLKFSGIISAIEGLVNVIRGVKTEAVAAETAVNAVGKAKAGGKLTPGVTETGGPAGPIKTGGILAGALGLGLIGYDAWQTAQRKALEGTLLKGYDQNAPTARPWVSDTWESLKKRMSYLTPGMGTVGEKISGKPSPSYGGASVDPKTGLFGTPNAGGLGIPPAALAKPTQTTNNDNKQITFHQSNSVSVQVQDDAGLASRIATSIGNFTGELFSGIARDLGRSSPRTEAATQ